MYVKNLLKMRSFYVVIACILIAVALFSLIRVLTYEEPVLVTDTVTRGDVTHVVTVSGIVEAEGTAELTFPGTGIVSNIFVKEGDSVKQDDVLATLEQAELQADRQDALATLLIARADRDELLRGPRSEEREVTDIGVRIAEEDLARITAEETAKVENARRTLLSDDLAAFPTDTSNSDTPPTITGTYTCRAEGEYILKIFSSGARSGYSYRLTGLESGTFGAFTESPAPMGDCGLFIQFDDDENYSSREWRVMIPNTRSASYATNLNAYELAQKQATNAIEAGAQALEKARREETLENAVPREEALRRANAIVLQGEARLAAVDARIQERTLRAPFDATVSNIDITKGEAAPATAAITLVASEAFELTVRIPEIDITRVNVGQPADVVFDAREDERLSSSIAFIAPLATEIDGVAYFEATLRFDTPPTWLRGGLNADVDIITDTRTNVLRIPKRFLIEENGAYFVLVPQGEEQVRTPTEVGFIGNDGYVEILDLPEGTTVIAP